MRKITIDEFVKETIGGQLIFVFWFYSDKQTQEQAIAEAASSVRLIEPFEKTNTTLSWNVRATLLERTLVDHEKGVEVVSRLERKGLKLWEHDDYLFACHIEKADPEYVCKNMTVIAYSKGAKDA